CDGLPGVPHLGQGRCARGLTVSYAIVELGQRGLPLQPGEPVSLLLPRQVSDIPADAIHREDTAAGIRLGEARKAALELATGKTQLKDERMRHMCWSFPGKCSALFPTVPDYEDSIVPDCE